MWTDGSGGFHVAPSHNVIHLAATSINYTQGLKLIPSANTDPTATWTRANGTSNVFAINATDVNVAVGHDDTLYGKYIAYGHATGSDEGGELRLHTAADYDTAPNPEYYRIKTKENFLSIGRTTNHDIMLSADPNIAFFVSSEPNYQGMVGGFFIPNATSEPTSAPTGGGFVWAYGDKFKWMAPSGHITVMGRN
jgi:hypothetical protein